MAIPWLRILDLVLTVTDVARKTTRAPAAALNELDEAIAAPARSGGAPEAKLATVVVAALNEAFNRDQQRLEFERERMEAERRRTDRLVKLDMARQAGDREIGRLRILAVIAVVSLLSTLVAAAFSGSGGGATRLAIGLGWVCLLASVATSFSGQNLVASTIALATERPGDPQMPTSGVPGAVTMWLVLTGVGLIAAAILLR